MKERPILFSMPMVRALLAGTKTQTRRTMKPQPRDSWQPLPEMVEINGYDRDGELNPDIYLGHGFCNDEGLEGHVCPYVVPGDRLWVRESFSGPWGLRDLPPKQWPALTPIHYWADGNPEDGDWTIPKPSIHLPRVHSRILLELTDVRVQRLQEISEEDAIAEGLAFAVMNGGSASHPQNTTDGVWQDPRRAYRSLWESINGAGSWDANPWVWVLTFRCTE